MSCVYWAPKSRMRTSSRAADGHGESSTSSARARQARAVEPAVTSLTRVVDDGPDLRIQVVRVGPVAVPPAALPDATAPPGMDLHAALAEPPLVIAARARARMPTGLVFAIPARFEGQVRPRSGLAATHRRHGAQRAGHRRQRLPRRGAGAAREPERRPGRPSSRSSASRSSSSRPSRAPSLSSRRSRSMPTARGAGRLWLDGE